MLATGAIVVVAGARRGHLPAPRNLIGLGFVYVFLAVLSDTAPKLAAPMAGLVATSALLIDGPTALEGVSAAEAGKTDLGKPDPIASQAAAFRAGGGDNADGTASPQAERAVRFARAAVGIPYRLGGESSEGYDCSGLTQMAYRSAGVSIPRTAQEQHDANFQRVSLGQLIPGDLVYSSWGSETGVGHVVIYAGKGTCIAAPHTGTTVQPEPLSTFTDPAHYKGANRPAPMPLRSTLAGAHR